METLSELPLLDLLHCYLLLAMKEINQEMYGMRISTIISTTNSDTQGEKGISNTKTIKG
jgi:hypothetical protein